MSKLFNEGAAHEKSNDESKKNENAGVPARRSKKRIVRMNPAIKAFELPPSGIYRVIIIEIREEDGKFGMNYVPVFEVLFSKNAGLTESARGKQFRDLILIKEEISPNSKFGRFVRAFSGASPAELADVDLDSLIHTQGWVNFERKGPKIDYIIDQGPNEQVEVVF